MKVRNPEKRLRAFTSVCQTKRTCEHTGGPQPTYRLEHGTLKIMAEFPKPKDDDDEAMAAMEAVERKQVRRAVGWGWVLSLHVHEEATSRCGRVMRSSNPMRGQMSRHETVFIRATSPHTAPSLHTAGDHSREGAGDSAAHQRGRLPRAGL